MSIDPARYRMIYASLAIHCTHDLCFFPYLSLEVIGARSFFPHFQVPSPMIATGRDKWTHTRIFSIINCHIFSSYHRFRSPRLNKHGLHLAYDSTEYKCMYYVYQMTNDCFISCCSTQWISCLRARAFDGVFYVCNACMRACIVCPLVKQFRTALLHFYTQIIHIYTHGYSYSFLFAPSILCRCSLSNRINVIIAIPCPSASLLRSSWNRVMWCVPRKWHKYLLHHSRNKPFVLWERIPNTWIHTQTERQAGRQPQIILARAQRICVGGDVAWCLRSIYCAICASSFSYFWYVRASMLHLLLEMLHWEQNCCHSFFHLFLIWCDSQSHKLNMINTYGHWSSLPLLGLCLR